MPLPHGCARAADAAGGAGGAHHSFSAALPIGPQLLKWSYHKRSNALVGRRPISLPDSQGAEGAGAGAGDAPGPAAGSERADMARIWAVTVPPARPPAGERGYIRDTGRGNSSEGRGGGGACPPVRAGGAEQAHGPERGAGADRERGGGGRIDLHRLPTRLLLRCTHLPLPPLPARELLSGPCGRPPPPAPRTEWTRRVPHPVLIGPPPHRCPRPPPPAPPNLVPRAPNPPRPARHAPRGAAGAQARARLSAAGAAGGRGRRFALGRQAV